ncbi:MAG: hypothetical protein ISS29_07160 [Candidatus Marinimicrobia bacterium]|nr:hypothetical protein [Candidatus Neomarinimicrobiota bacterium]
MNISVIPLFTLSDLSEDEGDQGFPDKIKQVLKILEESPGFGTCHLTFHTKYLKSLINAESDWIELIKRLIDEKRLLCGPWYLPPNDCLANGETLIRNLFLGDKICYEIGNIMKVGYTTLSCRNNSQLPQIFNGFNIDTAFIPITTTQNIPNAFIWEGVDGSNALVKCFYQRNLNNGIDFEDLQYISHLEKNCTNKLSDTPVLLISDFDPDAGADRLKNIIDYFNSLEGVHAELMSLPDYFWRIKEKNTDRVIKVLSNESIPFLGLEQTFTNINCARIRTSNSHAEHSLQFYAEPWNVIQQQTLGVNAKSEIQSLWESLLSLQYSTYECPKIDRNRIRQIRSQYRSLLNQINTAFTDSIMMLLKNIQLPDEQQGYYFTVVNPLPFSRTEIIDVDLELPGDIALEKVAVEDLSGRKISCMNVSKTNIFPVFKHQDDIHKTRYRCFLELSKLPAMGYKTYKIIPTTKSFTPHRKNIVSSHNCLENDFIKVTINLDGTFNIFSKETGAIYRSLGYFIDTVLDDRGKSKERIITTSLKPRITRLDNNTLFGSFKIEYEWVQDNGVENQRTKISVILSLNRLSRFINIDLEVVDKADDHKIDCYFPADFKIDHIYSDLRFDIQEISSIEEVRKKKQVTMSLNSFIGLSDEIAGFAIVCKEIRSAFINTREKKYLSLPILEKQSLPSSSSAEKNGTSILKYTLSFYPYLGGWENGQVLSDAYARIFGVKLYMIDKAEGSLPTQMEFLKIEPADLCFSALKFNDNGSAILRFFNSTQKIVKGFIKTHFPLTAVNILSLEEFVIESLDLKNDYEIPLMVLPKKIVTLELKFKKQ